MKGLITLLALGVLGAAGAWWYYQTQYRGAYQAAKTVAEQTRTQQQAKKQVDDCRDQCEQAAVVGQTGDEALRACRARCEGRAPEAKRPYEPIRSISVAPADHSRSLPPAVEAERQRLRNIKPR
jgi:hypothetical protein